MLVFALHSNLPGGLWHALTPKLRGCPEHLLSKITSLQTTPWSFSSHSALKYFLSPASTSSYLYPLLSLVLSQNRNSGEKTAGSYVGSIQKCLQQFKIILHKTCLLQSFNEVSFLSTFFPLKGNKVEKSTITPRNKKPNKKQYCNLLQAALLLQVKRGRDSCLSPSPPSVPSLHKYIKAT